MASRCSASDAGSMVMGVAEGELNQLEEIILSKIQQRTPSRMSEDTYIVKAFKYHDLGETGWVDFNKFKRAFSPFTPGILDQDVRLIFDRYAPDGGLNYKQFAIEFVRGIRRRPGADMPLGSEAGSQQPQQQAWEGPEECLMRMKGFLNSQGPRAIIALASSFREVDPENSRIVDQESFHHVLAEHFSMESSCPVQDVQVSQIFQLFQQPFSPGQIAYDEFLQSLKDEPLNPERRASVRAAFRRLDTNSEGLVDLNRMIKAYNPTRHPQVSDGTRQPDEVLEEFVETIKDSVAFRRGQRCYPSSLVAWEEFEDYYKFVSGAFESDAIFCTVLQRVWDLDKAPDQSIETRAALARPAAGIPAKSRAGLHHWQSNTLPANKTHLTVDHSQNLMEVIERARKFIASKGLRHAVDVVKNFYAADDDVDDFLDVYEFRRACQQSGITLREQEETACFEKCGDGMPSGQNRGFAKIHLQRFLRLLHGPVIPQRLSLIEAAFRSLGGDPSNEGSSINPSMLKQNFAAEGHPLVVKGELDAGFVLGEFLDTFSLLAHILGGCQNGAVAFSDFLAYYDLVSSTIDSDALFDLLMHRLWPIGEQLGSAASSAELEQQGQQQPGGGMPVSPSKRWATPAVEAPENPIARQRPPTHDGPGAYGRNPVSEAQDQGHPDAHRRFAAPRVGSTTSVGFSPITRSQIVFNDTESGELGAVIQRLRASLARRGLKGWRLLGERFAQHDHRRNGTVMRLDWQRLHRSLGLGLSPEEQELIFKGFSKSRRDGAMDYGECMRHLRGPLDERRHALVGRLFEELVEGGCVPAEKLKACYDVKNSPQCLVGMKDMRSEMQEFCEAVDYFSAPAGGRLSAEGFADFFTMVSSIYREEDEFKLMTTSAFGLRSGGMSTMGGC
mmetsp:Transcript_123382/g.308241  ORF Transcript_123382/g.308241 Transcript_123382/m.308241 type:complete len:898 (-) Transcript_123382:201-2894(-)